MSRGRSRHSHINHHIRGIYQIDDHSCDSRYGCDGAWNHHTNRRSNSRLDRHTHGRYQIDHRTRDLYHPAAHLLKLTYRRSTITKSCELLNLVLTS